MYIWLNFTLSMTVKRKKIIVLSILLAVLIVAISVWFVFTVKFNDMKDEKSAYNVNALDLINEFKKNDSIANKKYAEKIMTISGLITEMEPADSSINIKLGDTLTGSYVIFAFQPQHLKEVKSVKKGDRITIKGSCSGGAYSEILENEFISFKRCTIIK